MKKWVKIVLWVAGVLLALIVAATLVAAPVAKGYINKHGEELVGRRVYVDQLRLNVYTGHVAVRGLSLYEEGGEEVFASFDTLDIKVSLLKLLSHTVQLKHITLAGLRVNVLKDSERFNFSSIIDHFAGDSTETVKDTTPSDWVMKFYNIRLSHAQLHYRDLGQGKQWHLPDINLRVPGFVLGGEEQSEGGLNIGFADGGHLNIDGGFDSKTGNYSLTATLAGFALRNIQPMATDFVRLDRIEGTLEARLKAEGDVGEIMKSRIGGTFSLANLDLRHNGEAVASLNALNIDIANINLDANSYELRSITLDGLQARYEQWKDHSTLDNLLIAQAAGAPADSTSAEPNPAPADSAAPAKPLRFTLGQLMVSNCAVTYDDHTLPDEFHFPVTNISVEASDLSFSGMNNAKLRAMLPGGGHLMMNWKGDIDNWKQSQQLLLLVKGLDMKQLSPWTVAYTGQPVEDGVFGLTSRLTITNSQLDNQNHIDIYNARVGSRRKDVKPEMKIPLKTALYILRDKDDKIIIDMPIKGNVDSPEFSYMKLVWKTLGNLLVKVATSPARALGNAMGLNGDNLEFIAIEPGQRGLTSEQYHQLADLAALTKKDSLLSVTLTLRMPEAPNDTVARGYQMRNEIVRRYLVEQGANERQIAVTTGDPAAPGERTGYTITSDIKIEE